MTTIRTALAIAAALGLAAAAHAADVPKDYPLTTCVVSGETLGSHGQPFVFEHEGKTVVFCCKGCRKDFLKEPATYLKKIDDARKAATN